MLETGEHEPRSDISLENLEENMKEDEVFLILVPEMRRIYIWKGRQAPVTKKFVSSRVAQNIQREKVRNAGMQHKIVSIDQDDELDEFIDNLQLKNVMSAEEREKERLRKEEEEAKRFEELMARPDVTPAEKEETEVVQASSYVASFMQKVQSQPSFAPVTAIGGTQAPAKMSDKEKQEILDSIVKEPVPDGLLKEHLILDEDLYVNMKKKAIVFDKETEIETWDTVNGALKDGMMDIGIRHLRILVKEGNIKAIEILKVLEDEKAPAE